MKTYAAELIFLFLQLLVFYIFPLFAGSTDAMGMVFLMLLATLGLSLVLGWLSKRWSRFLWPFVTAAVFIPSVWIWYNSSAIIHAAWYLAVSAAGVLTGSCLRKLTAWMQKKN